MNNLPPNWSRVKLGDIAKSYKGKKPKRQNTEKNSIFCIPYVDIKAFENRGIDNFTDGEKCTLCEPDEVLIVWDGARCGLVGRGIKGAIGSTLAKIKSDSHLNAFLFYFIKQYYKLINSNPKGVGIPHIEPISFWNLEIPVLPTSIQQKIVAKIEELFSKLDSGVTSLKKAKEQIKTYRQAVLASAFSGRLTRDHLNPIQLRYPISKAADPEIPYGKELPKGWRWVKLGEVIDSLQYGTSDKASNNENGIPVLRMGNIQEGKLDYSSLKYFDKSYKELSKYLLNDGDLLFNRTNSAELVGKTALYKKHYPKSIFASYLIRVKVNKSIYSSDFLNYYINSLFGKNYIKSVVSQNVGQANVNGTKLKNMEVPLISLSKQNQIVEEIEKRFSEADNLEKAIDDSIVKAETLRQSILKQAFEGKLV